jgi:HK97 family phage portal protein
VAKQVKPDAVEQRALRPPVTPNGNPAGVPPASVAEPDYRPGDPDGVVLVDEGPGSPSPRSVLRPSPWNGWPAEWAMPAWGGGGHLEELCDIAWMCLDLNTWVLSSMPAYLVNAAPSLDAGWMSNPDPDIYSSWEEFARALFWDFWCGEAFVLITARYATGWPARFHVVEPWFVNVEIASDGHRSYTIGSLPVPRDDIIHLRYRATASQARGTGPLEVGRARLVAAQMLTRYASNFVAGGGLPAGIITHPEELTAEQSYSLQQQWVMSRTSSMGLPAVLSGGVEFNPTQQSPAQMGLVDLAQMNESRIAVLMGTVPYQMGLPSGGNSMTYSNVNSLFDYHWRSSLRTKAQMVMRGLSERLLPSGTWVELNRDAYIQPGPLERAQTWDILTRIGVLTAEQVSEFERYSVATSPVLGPIDAGALL